MDLAFLSNYLDPVVLGICLLVGYVLKNTFKKFPNQYIPLVVMVLGTVLAIVLNWKTGVSASVILGGMVSGLSSTGMYEMLRNTLALKKEDSGDE